MRDFHLIIPSDCVASSDPMENAHALKQMEKILKADLTASAEIDLEALKNVPDEEPRPRPQSQQFAPVD